MEDVRRFVGESPVIPLAAVIALAGTVLIGLFDVVYGFAISPWTTAFDPTPAFFHLFGYSDVDGRLVSWSGALQDALALALLGAAAFVLLRQRQHAFTRCPHCTRSILRAAHVCRHCRNGVAA